MSNNKTLNVKSLKEMLCIIPGIMYAEKIQESEDHSCETHRLFYTEKAYKEIENLLYDSSYYKDDYTIVTMKHRTKEDLDSLLYEGGVIYGVKNFKEYIDQRLTYLKESNSKVSWRSVINFVDYTSTLCFYSPSSDCKHIEFDKNILINHSEVLLTSHVRVYKNVFNKSYVNLSQSVGHILNGNKNCGSFHIEENEFKNVTIRSDSLSESLSLEETVIYGDIGKTKESLLKETSSNTDIDLYIVNSLITDSKVYMLKTISIAASKIRDCGISGNTNIYKSTLQGLEVVSVSFHNKRVVQPRLHLCRCDSKSKPQYYSGHGVIGLGHDSIQVVSYDDQISMATIIGSDKTIVNCIEDLTLESLDDPNTNLTVYKTCPNRLTINRHFKDFIKYVINKITL